jgi:hypothetical protein
MIEMSMARGSAIFELGSGADSRRARSTDVQVNQASVGTTNPRASRIIDAVKRSAGC